MNNKNKIDLGTTNDLMNNLVVYEKSNDIRINASDLKLEFIHFKEAINNIITLPILLAVISVWITLITADFKSIFGINKEIIYGFYLMFSVFITFLLLNPLLVKLIKSIAMVGWIKDKIQDWLETNETDPEIKVNVIQKKCQNFMKTSK